MAYVPFAQEIGAVYTLTSPSGAQVVFNDPTSPNYGGMIAEITGLDSAEVRESAEDLVEADGGTHGAFYFGRRPITMKVQVVNHSTRYARAERIDRIHRAAQGLRSDSILSWAPTYALTTPMFVPVRLQQPIRDTGGWNKDVALALVSEYAVILGGLLKQSGSIASGGAGEALENQGSYEAYPTIEITGMSTNPVVNSSNGGSLKTKDLVIASGEKLEFDTLNHSARFTAGARNGQSGNRYINFATTVVWPFLSPAANTTFTLTGGGSAVVKYRDAWH